jgi:peptidyl-prolyl cis-trans isomerase SurA
MLLHSVFRPTRVLAALALTFAVAEMAAPPHAIAQSAIRVVVNDEPVTTYEVQNRTRMLRLFSGGRQGEEEALEQLIDEKLMLQEAKRRGMGVTEAEVDAEFARRAGQAGLSPDQFAQAFRQNGVDVETFKEFLLAGMVWSDIVRARVRATVDVTETDVAAALEKRAGVEEQLDQQAASEYMLQQILFVIPEKAGAGVEAQRKNDANAFRAAFRGCDSSLEQAKGVPGVVVKPKVRREENQISGELKEAIAQLEIGGIAGPERVAEGFQLVAICDKKTIAGHTVTTQKLERELTNERGQMLARRYLRDLRSDAVIDYR